MQGVVGIFNNDQEIFQWKNFENWLRFQDLTEMWPHVCGLTFLAQPVYHI